MHETLSLSTDDKVKHEKEPKIGKSEEFHFYTEYFDSKLDCFCEVEMSEAWQYRVFEISREYDIEYELLLALFGCETGFDVHIGVSDNGLYIGPGMLNIEYCADYLKKYGIDVFTTSGGIEGAAYIFREKLRTFDGNVKYALMAYNGGTNYARSRIRQGIISSTYAERVLEIREGLFQSRKQ